MFKSSVVLVAAGLLVSHTSRASAAPAQTDLATAFADNGTLQLPGYTDMKILPLAEDKFLLVGAKGGKGNVAHEIMRFGADGKLDESFGGGGKVVSPFMASQERFGDLAAAVGTDGKIVLANGAGVARFNADGSIDKSWGQDGQVALNKAFKVAALNDGKVLVVALNELKNPSPGVRMMMEPYVVLLDASGKTDLSFPQFKFDKKWMWPTTVEIAANPIDGGFLVYGCTSEMPELNWNSIMMLESSHFAITTGLWRFNANGKPEGGFGKNGYLNWKGKGRVGFINNVKFNADSIEFAGSCDQADGTPLGDDPDHASLDLALVRLDGKGNVVPAFGSAKTSFDLGGVETATGMATWPDGSGVVAVNYATDSRGGEVNPTEGRNHLVLRFDSAGKLDEKFIKNGKPLKIPVTGGSEIQLATQSNGRFLFLGSEGSRGTNQFIIEKTGFWVKCYNGTSVPATEGVAAAGMAVNEIQLEGTVTAVQGGNLEIKATAFVLPNGKRSAITPPKVRKVQVSGKTQVANKAALKAGAAVVVVGVSPAGGAAFQARMVRVK